MVLLLLTVCVLSAACERTGKAAYDAFTEWRTSTGGTTADWHKTFEQYRAKLKNEGLSEAAVTHAMRAIEAYGEAELYDGVYAAAPTFNTQPSTLLVDAIKGRRPGDALDVAMGQGRNSVYLATHGWNVTGFDVSKIGLRRAEELAKFQSVTINAIHSSDDDFDFGTSRWDLIAMIYLIEKRTVHRIRTALKPGGIVVIEAGHKSASGAPFEYDSGELPAIFKGFRILRYEEITGFSDWGNEPITMVRLIAEKPR